MDRRKFVKAFGTLPLLSKTQIVKETLDKEATALINVGGFSGIGGPPAGPEHANFTKEHYKIAFSLAHNYLESLLYETDCKYVYHIDPDLAVKRSFSLSAKITFQRQRNVAQKISELQTHGAQSKYYWFSNAISKIIPNLSGKNTQSQKSWR